LAVIFTIVVESFGRADGAFAVVDAGAGAVFLALAVMMRRESPRFALIAAAAGVAWLLAGSVVGVTWLHRPLAVGTVLAFPDGRLRTVTARAVLALSLLLGVVPGLATDAAATAIGGIALAGLGVSELIRSRGWPGVSSRARGWAAICLGSAFLVPLAAQLYGEASPAGVEAGYTVLVGAAGTLLLVTAASGGVRAEAEAVITLTEGGDASATLEALKSQMTSVDPATQRAVDVAVALLERNVAAQRDLGAAVGQARRSRRRLVTVTTVQRRALRRRLAEHATPLIPDIQGLLASVDTDDPATADLLVRCCAETDGIASDLDALANGLHPVGLAELGLLAIGDLAARSTVPIEVTMPEQRFGIETESAIWYVCAEAVTNAVKHAHATRIWIVGRQVGGMLTVEIGDDGVGGAQPTDVGGLTGLRDRVVALDGHLVIDSPKGRGTAVRLDVPLP
jgi:hypothetical protein